MKRHVFAAAAAMILAGPWAVRASAQDDGEEGKRAPRPEFAEKMQGRMKEELGLTDDQAAKLETAMKQRAENEKPLREKLKDKTKKLAELVKNDASDADIQAAIDALKTARKEMMAGHEKFESSLASFLKPKQRAKLLIKEMRGLGRRLGRHGPPHGMGHGMGRPDDRGDGPPMPPRGGERDDDAGE